MTYVMCRMISYDHSFKLICHMPILQIKCECSENRFDPKEYTKIPPLNTQMVVSKIKSYIPNDWWRRSFNFASHMLQCQQYLNLPGIVLNPRENAVKGCSNAGKAIRLVQIILQLFQCSLFFLWAQHDPTYNPPWSKYSVISKQPKRRKQRLSFRLPC